MRRLGDLGEGRQRPFEIVGGGKKRLRFVRSFARNKTDAAALRTPIEQKHAARGRLAHDFKPRDLVAEVERKVERERPRRIRR